MIAFFFNIAAIGKTKTYLVMFVCSLQVVSEAQRGNVFGEVGVLCYRPQLFTVRTKRLSQLLRLNRTVLLNLVQANVGDGAIIMNNLLQVCINPLFFSIC